jgi:flagellar hook-length control protein FliK
MESADAASTTAALSVLSAQSKLPAQAGPVPVDVSVDDIALQISDRDRVSASANISARDMDLPLALQAQQALNKADAFISSSSPLVRMQLASPDSSQQLNSIDKELAVKAGLMPQSNTRETAEPQLILKAGSVLAEPEPLITTRMQLSGLNQAGELPGHKLTLESMLTQTQPAATDSLNASLSRAPLLQTALSAELLTTTTSSQPVISETFGRADWGQGMGKQILWMVNQNISSAEFRLNPANLGPLEVRIDMDNDQVNVAFSSRHADVRDAVEQALPKLREMFEDKGLNLSDADVSQHSFAEQRENAFEQGEASGLSFTAENDDMAEQHNQGMDASGIGSMLNEGLVDYYI